jgi:hypothetical protein
MLAQSLLTKFQPVSKNNQKKQKVTTMTISKRTLLKSLSLAVAVSTLSGVAGLAQAADEKRS